MKDILEREDLFLLNLYEKLDNKYNIVKATSKFCNVDFLMTNPINLKTLYIEHKYRNVEDKYDTLYIGKTKVNNINLHYKNCIIVWEFNTLTNDAIYYYFEATDNMTSVYDMCYVAGSTALKIVKKDCGSSLDSLLDVIKQKLN
jgi:hypothetical protein